ncbi:MAG TPA: hypothetical protein VLW65_15545 [Bryobacteraceae bacterium]|nr:hypothetical protein [Bryobacteraceae bacterium]
MPYSLPEKHRQAEPAVSCARNIELPVSIEIAESDCLLNYIRLLHAHGRAERAIALRQPDKYRVAGRDYQVGNAIAVDIRSRDGIGCAGRYGNNVGRSETSITQARVDLHPLGKG